MGQDIALQQPADQIRKAFDRLRVRRECFSIKHFEDDKRHEGHRAHFQQENWLHETSLS